MAKKPKNQSGGGKDSGNGKGDGNSKKPGLSPATIKQQLSKAIREEMDTIRRTAGLNTLYLNKSLGVGDMKTFEKEWEKFFAGSAILKPVSQAEKAIRDNTKPALNKVSTETPVVRKPKPKGK